jgi:hypothetical protein
MARIPLFSDEGADFRPERLLRGTSGISGGLRAPHPDWREFDYCCAARHLPPPWPVPPTLPFCSGD